jgi:cob(I)alamin adenosyltransferase
MGNCPSKCKGLLQVYTGNGKGKTTAALGLALRAAGAGQRVFIAQFVKGMKYSELNSLKRLRPRVTVKQYGLKRFIRGKASQKDVAAARKGLKEAGRVIASGKYDLVVLDEANIATYFNLFRPEELLNIILRRPANVEIVVTGRYADKRVIDAADLVTEMRDVKHYFAEGVRARRGIEH